MSHFDEVFKEHYVPRSEYQALEMRMKLQVEALESKLSAKEEILKMKEDVWISKLTAKEEVLKLKEDVWKSKEENWKLIETALKSNNIKTEKQAVLPPLVIDALVQTDCVTGKNEACQTEKSTTVDFEVQTNLKLEKRTFGTQTIKVENQEIAMPNKATSVSSKKAICKISSSKTSAQNPISIQTVSLNDSKQAKKRKFYQTRSSTSNSDKSSPDETENQSVHSRAEEELGTVEDSVLKSDVYKIYCHYKDFNEAKTAIKELKNFAVWHEPSREMPSEDRLKHLVGALCPQGKPNLNQIREYIDNVLGHLNLTDNQWHIYLWLDKSFTKIVLVSSNGFEVWFIKDFEKGQTISKWYRGYACTPRAASLLAKLKFLGIKVSFTNKISKTFSWVDFAESSLSLGKWKLYDWSFEENKTENLIEITAILELQHKGNLKKFVGKSNRPLTEQNTKNEFEMENEAKYFALADFFKQIYGYTDIQKEISIDELYRPLND